jgi:tetratricopeptide (TPR) repeat protein
MPIRPLVLLCLLLVLYPTGVVKADQQKTGEQRFANSLVRLTRTLLAPAPHDHDKDPDTPSVTLPLSTEILDTCLIMLQKAVELQPQDPESWRLLLELAIFVDAQELIDAAVTALVQLDPDDERVRLMRLNRAVDHLQTVDERIALYEQLLMPEQIKQIGAPIASRLAFDLALLYQRKGEPDKYAYWLAEATAIDSANPTAAGAATGYFINNVADEYAQAELLVNMLMSNPTDPGTQVTLAEMLLGYGAYEASARMYDLAVNTTLADKRVSTDKLYADQAIAQWGAGNLTQALRTISDRQRIVDQRARNEALSDEVDMTPVDVADVRGYLSPTIATVRAVILNDDPERGTVALDQVIEAVQYSIENAIELELPSELINDLRMQVARIVLWLGGDLEIVEEFMADCEAAGPLDEVERCPIDAWIALRRDDPDRAAELFDQCDDEDPAVLTGLAELHLLQGDRRAAARLMLRIAREQAGTVAGIAAANQLTEIVGKRPPISELARRLEALIETIPFLIDRYPANPTLAASIRIEPSKRRFEAYEPVLVQIHITNRSILPLAIDPSGPIKTQVLLIPTLQVPRLADLDEIKPIVVNIGRQLRLEPGETTTMEVDLRRTGLGNVQNLYPLLGGSLRLQGIFNLVATSNGLLEGGIYGSETDSAIIRLDGMRVDAQWLATIVERIRGDDPDPVDLVLLGHVIAMHNKGVLLTDQAQLIGQADLARVEAFGRLDPASQAWILSVSSRIPQNEPLLAIARKSDDQLLKLGYLLFHLEDTKDPMLAAALRDEDPFVRNLAEMIEPRLSPYAALFVTPPSE